MIVVLINDVKSIKKLKYFKDSISIDYNIFLNLVK